MAPDSFHVNELVGAHEMQIVKVCAFPLTTCKENLLALSPLYNPSANEVESHN